MTIQHVVEGAGAPSAAPPSLGAHYINTTTEEQYLAKGTASVADWVLQEKGMSKSEADEAYQPKGNYQAAGSYATTQQLADGLANKVSSQQGKGLSSEDYTTDEKAKLAGLEGSHYRGTFVSLAALQSAMPSGVAGDYADVDAGAGESVARYLWDASDKAWTAQQGAAEPLTASQVKSLYESNPDTNAFTDAEKTKLAGLDSGGGGGGGGGDDTIIEDYRSQPYKYFFGKPATPPARMGQKCLQLDANGSACEWIAFLDYDGVALSWARSVLPLRFSTSGLPLQYVETLTPDMRAFATHTDEDTEVGKDTTFILPAMVPDTEGVWGDYILPHDGMPLTFLNNSEHPWTVTLSPSQSWEPGYAVVVVEAYGFAKLGVTVGQQGESDREVVLVIPAGVTMWIDLTLWRAGTEVGYYMNANRLYLP